MHKSHVFIVGDLMLDTILDMVDTAGKVQLAQSHFFLHGDVAFRIIGLTTVSLNMYYKR